LKGARTLRAECDDSRSVLLKMYLSLIFLFPFVANLHISLLLKN
jgi:hypothetical protein